VTDALFKSPHRRARARRVRRRRELPQIVLAAVFAFAALPKLTGAHTAVTMFGQIGAGQWLRYLVGIAELAGAAGLLIPRLAGLAADICAGSSPAAPEWLATLPGQPARTEGPRRASRNVTAALTTPARYPICAAVSFGIVASRGTQMRLLCAWDEPAS